MNKKEYFTPSVKVVYMATRERLMSVSSGDSMNSMDFVEGETINVE